MLLPFFPEPTGAKTYSATLGDTEVKIYVEGADDVIATPGDRRILSILSAAFAHQIRHGLVSRHVNISVNDLIRGVEGDRPPGGEDYARLKEKLSRLMATVIETSQPTANGLRRNKRFRWIDKFEYESSDRAISGTTRTIKVSLSEEAYTMMAFGPGFDTPSEAYLSVISNPSSTWRIYEICLATLLNNRGENSMISMEELHQRVPMQCPVKMFKSRALRKAFDSISTHPEMSRRLSLRLMRRSGDAVSEIQFSERTPAQEVFIMIEAADVSDISTDSLLSSDAVEEKTMV